MLRIAMEEFSPRFSVDSPRNSGSLSFPSLMIDGFSRKSFSYSKLPGQPLKLSVRKLDGSCFDIEVMKTASIAELRLAVEAAFSHMPKKGPGKISWPHVWGHFCLSFAGQKLISETDYIKHYGIKDGDQLQFIRHHSISYIMTRKQSKKQEAAKQRYMLSSQSYISNEKYQELSSEEDCDCDDVESGRYRYHEHEDESIDSQNDSRFVHFLRGWFSYSRLVSGERTRYKCKPYPSRTCDFLGGFRNIIQLYGSKNYYRRSSCRED
ncbi:U11/U12 small nuclear ribonucleoprotein 25 kDa protein-like [Melia azedarach]|uniref:U11/U12 small nuclear ribonucleoprotein 25 kDa protein-like n=1 Tax=Melia azedarach TaxID=155640 RepID=A0ACC1X971_MELAZ|nr:U11/U12 small nuclear ribonucleoprotein 25 kDa protein-like [Melia azedarach]